jgi:twinkle protein|tara:strand:- start:1512 stop:3251 length:1740 start_codon:yes stop_codon:yes gene_type:complete
MQQVAPEIERLAATLSYGQHKEKCPMCIDERSRNRHDKSLSIKIDSKGVQYQCHHCDISGGIFNDNEWSLDATPLVRQPISRPKVTTNKVAIKYLKTRNISDDVIESHTIPGEYRFNGKTVPAVGFPYRDGKDINAIKWRSADTEKRFSQENVCEDFFNIDNYKKGNDVLICEGELDALAWLSVELPENLTVLSIPNGAPARVKDGKIDPNEDNKFKYIWRAKKQLDSAPRIILNTDNDGPGNALAEEIMRRIGRHKIWTVDLDKYKDAADALNQEGLDYLQERLEDSEPLPMIGLHRADTFYDALHELYEHGQMRGAYTGLSSLDKLIQIPMGMVSVVTGFPSSGKSDFIDQLCVNLAESMGYKTVFCSFEKPPELHMMQLAQKRTKKEFFDSKGQRMNLDELDSAKKWIDEHFLFMDYRRNSPSKIDGILDVASSAVMQMGCRILVIDPYNYIELSKNGKETDEISGLLTSVQQWAKSHDAHVFFIAHPTKVGGDGRGQKIVPTGNDVSGSAAWYAKADLGWTLWRDQHDIDPPEVHIWKVRWSWIGNHGVCPLKFDRTVGVWSDYNPSEDSEDWDF